MRKNKRLFDTKIEELKKDSFYRQRFDACPHFMSFIGEAHTSVTNHSNYPFGQKSAYCKFVKDRADWYHSNSQLRNTSKSLLSLLKTDSQLIQNLKKDVKPKIKRFYQRCNRINRGDLGKLDKKTLIKEYTKLKTIYLDKLFVSALIDGFSLVTDELIRKKINVELQGQEVDNNSVFEKLTANTFVSFLQEEEISLLKIKKKIINQKDKKEEFISAHQKKYFWLQNNYVDDIILQPSFFEKRINSINNKLIEDKISAIKELPKHHKKEGEKIFLELCLSIELKRMIELTDLFNYLQDERKKSTFWATHYFSLFLEELSTRTGFSKENLKYSVPSEFEKVLQGKIKEIILSKRRTSGCIVLWYKDEYQVITDKEQIKILDSLTNKRTQNVKIIKGFVASKGIISGKVKVVESVKEIHKVKTGDIIVAVMTRPDYLPAMQKAAGFVTDEGGVTCHAAIIAREMKKPCIIGTKIATKVLKDGNIIEVNADKGIVRVLEN